MAAPVSQSSNARIYWTAFIGLLFDYYDLYLFVYLEKVLAAQFALTPAGSNALQFIGLAGVARARSVSGPWLTGWGAGG